MEPKPVIESLTMTANEVRTLDTAEKNGQNFKPHSLRDNLPPYTEARMYNGVKYEVLLPPNPNELPLNYKVVSRSKSKSSKAPAPPAKTENQFAFNVNALEWSPPTKRSNPTGSKNKVAQPQPTTYANVVAQNVKEQGSATSKNVEAKKGRKKSGKQGKELEGDRSMANLFMADPTVNGPPRPPLSAARFGNYIPIRILHPKAPWDFYIQNHAPFVLIKRLIDDMTRFYNSLEDNREVLAYSDFKMWGFYAARVLHPQEYYRKWTRVLVMGKTAETQKRFQLQCAMIDLGGVQFIDNTNLRRLRTVDTELPWGAYKGTIKTIRNNDYRGRSGIEAQRGFRDLVKERRGEFYGLVVDEIDPDRHNREPFPTWEIFITTP